MSQKVLFVCLGNICRSPMAEAIFKHKIKEKGLESAFEGDSCGTANYHVGDWPDPRTIKCVNQNGVEINHTGRQLKRADLDHFDLILAMDNANYRDIINLSTPQNKHKIKMMRAYDPLGPGEVPDPYYGGAREFQEVFDMLDRSIEKLIE